MNDNQSREPDLQAILAAIESDQTDVDNKIISERNADMASVKKDLQSLKDVTFDVASMVVQQGDELSVGQKRTSRARMAVEAGTREMKFARQYKKQSRTKCCVVICCVIFVLLVGGTLAFLMLFQGGTYWHKILNMLGIK